MPVSLRRQQEREADLKAAAAAAGKSVKEYVASQEPKFEYEITDPHHKPDLHGEFATGKVYTKNGVQHVRITERAAKFYVDSGTLKKVEVAPPQQG